ncbi:unnamed protein product [Cylindrotheca closterium]|uniref:Uncharacterized protein n=1 Tax=Cylindrotheca closterium TaxID=2856 RepID=A0AAD2FZ55_9STRA|nr:unnamed protein product [Cylindrotheca closterium]
MMRSDSDLDEVESIQELAMTENEESTNDEIEEAEPTGDDSISKASKKEWRKLWRSQKAYWRERESEANHKYDERDEAPSGGGEEGNEGHSSLNDDGQNDEHEDITQMAGEESAVGEDSDENDTANNNTSDIQSPKKGWKLLKILKQRRAQEKENGQGEATEEEGVKNEKNEEEESALWRDISFTIGSLTDDDNGQSTDEDGNKSLENIEEEILRQASIENNNDDGSGVIPPSPWSSLKRLRDKIKDNSTPEAEEEVKFFGDDYEADTRIDQLDEGEKDQVDGDRDEAGDAPRAWVSLKRIRDKIKDNASINREEKNAKNGEWVQKSDDIDDGVVDASDDTAKGDEYPDAPNPWSSLKRFRDRIKDSSHPDDGEPDEPAESMDENVESKAASEAANDSDDTIENNGSNDEMGDETNPRRWGVLKRIRKKLDVDSNGSNDSIEDQIESLAKELEKEQQHSGISFANDENIDDDIPPEEDAEKPQDETNNGPRKGWTLLKRVQDRLTSEKEIDDETGGYDNIDNAFAFRTFHVLHTRNQELEDLVERLQRANEILKAECKLNTVKVVELSNMIETKGGNCVEDVLLQKSIENAELLMQVDELQVELNKANNSVDSLKVENKEQKRLIHGMGRVLDALHSTRVDDSSSNVPSMGLAGELSIDDLEPKVERIMEDREQLVLRCNQLERENELKDEQIEKLSEALDAQSFHQASLEKVKGGDDDSSVHSEMTRSTYTGTSVSSSSVEDDSDDKYNSRIRNLYHSVSSKMMSGNMMEIAEEDNNPYFDTETLCTNNDDDSSVNAIQGHGDDLESSIKKRLKTSDPKYVEFLSLMAKKGMVLKSVPSEEATEHPDERQEQETNNRDEIICELVI